MRIRTGYECVIPAKTSGVFIGKAKADGKITGIDAKLNLVYVTYKNGMRDVFEYGNIKGESSGQAVNHAIDIIPGLKVGSSVKAGDIITYHSEFFQFDPVTRQVAWCHGVPATVAIMAKDVTLEDSCMLSSPFAKKLNFDSIYSRPIQITTDMVVERYAEIGTKVSFNTPLLRMKYEDTANIIGEVDELFDELKQVEYRSKHDGVIVDIEVFHVAKELNASLTAFVNKMSYQRRRRANATTGTLKEEALTNINLVPAGTRIRGIQLENDDLLIVFSISASIDCGVGDKIVIGNQLKSVVGRIEDQPMVTDSGKNIDIVFGANSCFDRIVCGLYINGILDSTLEAAEKDVLKMYFG